MKKLLIAFAFAFLGLAAHSQTTYIYGDTVKIRGRVAGGAELLIAGGKVYFAPLTSAPSSPIEGMIYFNSTSNHFFGYLSGSWVQLDGGGGVISWTANAGTGLIGSATTGAITAYIDTITQIGTKSFSKNLVDSLGALIVAYSGDTSNIAYIVDSIANAPIGTELDGTKYLVGTSATGTFSGQSNKIATLTSGTWIFVAPTSQQQLIVDNNTDYSTYQYNGTVWSQTSILWRVGGNSALGNNAWFGRIDNKPIVFKIRKREVARFNTDSTLSMPKFKGILSTNVATWDSATGKLTYKILATSGGTVTSVTSANGDATVANTTTTPVITINSSPKLTTARNIAGVPFDGSANISLNNNAITNGAGYTTVAGAKAGLSLTTTGTSGAATYDNSTGVFNIPNYAGGAASKFGKDDILAGENRDFDQNNKNFAWHGGDTLSVSANNVFLGEGVAKMSLQSLGTTEILSSDTVNVSGVNVRSYGTNSNFFGKNSSLGFNTDATSLYANGLSYSTGTARKFMTYDTLTKKLTYSAFPVSSFTGLAGGSTNQVLKKNSGTDYDYSWASGSGVAGSDGQIQFNNSGAFGASGNLNYYSGSNNLQISGTSARFSMTTGAAGTGGSFGFIDATAGAGLKIQSSAGGSLALSIPTTLTTGYALTAGGLNLGTSWANGVGIYLNNALTNTTYIIKHGALNATATVGNNVAAVLFDNGNVTLPASGVNSIIANVAIKAQAIINGTGGTVTNSTALYIDGAPKGTGIATNAYALWVDTGNVRIDNRLLQIKGVDVASANDLTLSQGNTIGITGTTTINAITTTQWIEGSRVTLIFSGITTVKNNTAGGAGTAVILLNGGVDFVTTADDVLNLVLFNGKWYETSRSLD